MKRVASFFEGNLHPIFFMLIVYIISVFMAFFVCRIVYNSLHGAESVLQKQVTNFENVSAMK